MCGVAGLRSPVRAVSEIARNSYICCSRLISFLVPFVFLCALCVTSFFLNQFHSQRSPFASAYAQRSDPAFTAGSLK